MSTLPSSLRSLSLLSLWKFGGNAPSLLEYNQRHFRVEISTIESHSHGKLPGVSAG